MMHSVCVQLLCSAWPGRHQQTPAAKPRTTIRSQQTHQQGTAGGTGAGGAAAGSNADLAAPHAGSAAPCNESDTAAGGGARLAAPRAPSAVCAASGHGSGHKEANAGAGASSQGQQVSQLHRPLAQGQSSAPPPPPPYAQGQSCAPPPPPPPPPPLYAQGQSSAPPPTPCAHGHQAPAHTHCAHAACSCEAVAPSSSAASAPNGGPFIFCVSGIPLQLDRVRCRISLQLVPWADPDKQSLQLPDYEVQQGPIQPLPQDAYQAACLVPSVQQSSQTSQGDGGPQGAHASSTVSELLAGLPTDFDVALAMDAAGLGPLPCHAHSAPHWGRAWLSSKPEPLPKTGAEAWPEGVRVRPGQGASQASHGQGPNDGPAAEGGAGPGKAHAARENEQTEGASQPPAAHADGAGESSDSSSSGAAGPCPTVAAAGPCFKVITYASQEQHYNAAQVWEDFQSNPPPVKLAKVRGAASEDRVQDAKRARGGTSDQAGAEALAAGLRRSGRQRKPVQLQHQDTDTEDGDEQPGVSAFGDWEPVPLHGDEAGSE
ncbi:hypothetical protein DUNSADRAFT_16368 [Dunaliella salina]|uniref:Uncharacterized protein n=1 Tax=Dunaliella salina TaxID=3046 RepID=A0ABQ7G3R1_DUNSA|nr:hypothetical protein DUNSADRAFT_16368 [Dunaliella salina]|eukprot:KAF5829240.1 hypothetical protein DUNSADRAFT_16368 [Dunaliella salina]